VTFAAGAGFGAVFAATVTTGGSGSPTRVGADSRGRCFGEGEGRVGSLGAAALDASRGKEHDGHTNSVLPIFSSATGNFVRHFGQVSSIMVGALWGKRSG
jgi:hypothetical protein